MFGRNNESKMQGDMFERELQQNQEQSVMDYAPTQGDYLQEQSIDAKKAELTRWQQDIAEEIEFEIHLLKNEFLNDQGEWERLSTFVEHKTNDAGKKVAVYQKMKPKLNELGIHWFRSQINPNISRNLMMSNYDEDRILIILRSITIDFISHINYNRDLYEIEKGDMTHIVRVFKSIITPSFFRCLRGGERQAGTTIRKEIGATHYTESPPQKAPTIFGFR